MNVVWSMLSGIGSLLSRSKPEDFTEEVHDEVLFSENNEALETPQEEIPELGCQHRNGIVTLLLADYALIDQRYYVDLSELKDKGIKQGDVVKYIAYRTDINSEWKVKDVKRLEGDEWERDNPSETKSLIISENATDFHKIPTKIEKKIGRTLIFEGGIECDLDKVEAEFVPAAGDSVLLSTIVEVKNVDDKKYNRVIHVQRLQSLLSKKFSGCITDLKNVDDEIEGIIDSAVFFTSNVCEPSYVPHLNDLVVADAIESVQGSLSWRAISVRPISSFETDDMEFTSAIEEDRLLASKNGLVVTVSCMKKVIKTNEDSDYLITIENSSQDNHVLLSAVLRQFKDSDFMKVITDLSNPVPIPANTSFNVQMKVKPISSGYCTDVLILTFEGEFQIGCIVDIYLEVEHPLMESYPENAAPTTKTSVKPQINAKRTAAMKKLMVPTKAGFVVPGIRPIKPASFIPNKLDLYPIPKRLTDILINEDDAYKKFAEIEKDIVNLYPCMIEELNEKNYLLKFHNLLHIEDQELSIAIKKYDKERVSFDRRADYLYLEIPNLVESRPSLVIGDKLIASDPAVFGKDGHKYEGYIHKVLANGICLKFNESFHASYNGKDYSVTFVHSRTGIRRCHQAINLVHQHLGRHWLFPDTLSNLKHPQVNIVGEFPPLEEQVEIKHECGADVSGAKKKICNESDNDDKMFKQNGIGDNKKISVPKSVYKSEQISQNQKRSSEIIRPEGILKWVNLSLNHYQKDAVRNILRGEARPLPYVIFGPPGTGKTVTVVETILQIIHQIPYSRILVATPSNSSADLICDRLLSWNLLSPGDLVRVVGYNYINDDRIPAHLKPYCTVVDLKNSSNESTYEEDGIKYSNKQAIGRHRITVGTCVSVGILYTMGFPRGHFTHVIVDEAGQATEPEILIPLAFLNNDSHAILAGDPRQLGPVITSKIAESFGLGESLLSRFLMRFPYHRDPESYPDTNGYDPRLVTWLLYNYRSLPQILHLYSGLFYDSKLIPMVCNNCSEEAEILKKISQELPNLKKGPNDAPVSIIFHGIRGVNAQEEDSPSWFNDHEVIKVIEYLQDFYRCSLKNTDVGIITPYQKQVQKIRDMIKRCDLDLPKVGSVEEFQGQERKVIILSTVRSDEGLLERDIRHALGFVSSKQRLNVAISRARCLLVIVGNPHLLVKDISWRNLLKTCVENKCYIGCDLPLSVIR